MKQAGDAFSAEKITYPISLINSQCKNISPIFWSEDNSRQVVSYDFDAHGEHLMLLDEAGTLHLLDVTLNYKHVAELEIIPNGVKT